MADSLWAAIHELLGLDADSVTAWQMASRAAVIYVAALVMVRFGEKRFLGKSTAFDVILGVILGSVMSRAINGSAEFFPTIVAGFVLVGLHWAFASIAFRSDWFGSAIKGSPRILIKDGDIQWGEMRNSHISRDDLLAALRSNASLEDPAEVKLARLERSGEISVIKRGTGEDG